MKQKVRIGYLIALALEISMRIEEISVMKSERIDGELIYSEI